MSFTNKKKKVLFVGSFAKAGKDGSVGGQMFASKSLINSKINDIVDWILIDTTASTNLKINFSTRTAKALKRILLFIYYCCTQKIDIALIFTGDGYSFKEKGLMALIAKCFSAKVILAPRSGLIKKNLEEDYFLSKFMKYVFGKVDVLLCQGESWKEIFKKQNVPEEKLKVVQNWIDVSLYEKANPGSDKIKILFLAWVNKNKGIIELVEAVNELKDRYCFELIIAGEGEESGLIKSMISKNKLHNIVTFLGWVSGEKKYDLLRNTDIFILPSHYEGFPNALLEAMSSGIACISTNVGAVPDIIVHGYNGLIIPVNDKNGIVLSLSDLIVNKNKRTMLGVNGRQTVLENNSIVSAVSKLNQIIKSL
ncbi:MAG: glycosyltransferase family 4 protein [Saprospiraceae bacterium]